MKPGQMRFVVVDAGGRIEEEHRTVVGATRAARACEKLNGSDHRHSNHRIYAVRLIRDTAIDPFRFYTPRKRKAKR